MKDKISKFVANLLPNRVVLWAIVRAYAYTTTKTHPNETPDSIGYSILYRSWENKMKGRVDDNGDTPDARRLK